MAGDNNKSSFLFGLTLTELAFILFFILLFFASLTVKEKTMIIGSLNPFKEVVESIPQYKEKTTSEKVIWLKELVEKSDLSTKQQALIENNNDLNKENEAYKKVVELIPEFNDKTKQEKEVWLKELVAKSDSSIKNQELIEKNKALGERLTEVKQKISEKSGEVEFLRKQIIGLGGNAYPPCWENPKTKKPDYIYNIIISENGVTTFKGYKKYLEDKFLELPGSQDVLGKSDISVNEFMVNVSGVFKRSKEEECRHYVRIFDEAISKNAYKWPLHRIEQYFYKFEPNNPSYSHFLTESENSSGDNLIPNSPVLDSKDTITSPLDLIDKLEMPEVPNSNH